MLHYCCVVEALTKWNPNLYPSPDPLLPQGTPATWPRPLSTTRPLQMLTLTLELSALRLMSSRRLRPVTRTFSHHWIMVGKHLKILLLDFDAKFTLLIPSIELGKALGINKVISRRPM